MNDSMKAKMEELADTEITSSFGGNFTSPRGGTEHKLSLISFKLGFKACHDLMSKELEKSEKIVNTFCKAFVKEGKLAVENDKLSKELEEVKTERGWLLNVGQVRKDNVKLRTDLALAVSALEFYAEPDSWEKSEIDSLDVNDCNSDAISSNTPWGYPVNKGGKHAREALSKINQTEGNNDES